MSCRKWQMSKLSVIYFVISAHNDFIYLILHLIFLTLRCCFTVNFLGIWNYLCLTFDVLKISVLISYYQIKMDSNDNCFKAFNNRFVKYQRLFSHTCNARFRALFLNPFVFLLKLQIKAMRC